MAEPPIPAAGLGDGPTSYDAVFIHTTLETRLAMLVSPSDTVADLKKKIAEEHPRCFPKLGAIAIDGLKVKRGGWYYHLVDTMLVRKAFDGVQNSWFISVEASIKGKGIECFANHEGANLALVNVDTNCLEKEEEERVNLVRDAPRGVIREDDSLITVRNRTIGFHGGDGLAGVVAEMRELTSGTDHGNKVEYVEPLVGLVDHREDKRDEEAQEMEVEGMETRVDDSILQEGDLNRQFDEQAKEMEVVGMETRVEGDLNRQFDEQAKEMEVEGTRTKVDGCMVHKGDLNQQCDEKAQEREVQLTETRLDGNVMEGGDPNHPSNMKGKSKKRKRKADDHVSGKDGDLLMNESRTTRGGQKETEVFENASANGPKDGSKIDDVVSEKSDKPSIEVSEDESLTRKKPRTGKLTENEVRTMVSELNDISREPPTVSELAIGNEQRLLNATVEGSDAEEPTKKKKKTKSTKKLGREINASGDEQSMREAGNDNRNVVEEPHNAPSVVHQEFDQHMLQSSAVPLNEKENEIEGKTMVPESNDMTCEPPTVSQLPIGDERLVDGSDADAKKKKKKKSSKKLDREINVVGDEQSLKEAGKDDRNLVEEPHYAPPTAHLEVDEHISQPSTVLLKEEIEGKTMVPESNDMTCEPPTVSKRPIGDEQRLVDGSDADAKKKRKKKTSKKLDREINPGSHEQSLKEAGNENGNVAEEPHYPPAIVHQEANECLLQPSAASSKDSKNMDPVQDVHPSKDINDFDKPAEEVVSLVTSAEVPKEIQSEFPEAVPSEDLEKPSKKRKKSRKHKDSVSGIPVASVELGKDPVIDTNNEHGEMETVTSVKDMKEAAATESARASLLATDQEIEETIKNVVDSYHQAPESKAAAEVKERKSRKKAKKNHCSDAKNSQVEDKNNSLPNNTNLVMTTRTDDSVADLSDSGVNFKAYFTPSEKNQKNFDRSEITGAWTKTKTKKKREVQGKEPDGVSPKLPEASSLTGKLGSEAKPHAGSSGKVNKRESDHEDIQQLTAAKLTQDVAKPNGTVEHHPESSTNSSSRTKRVNKVTAGRGPKASQRKVVKNSTVRAKPPSGSNTLFGSKMFGSDDSLETYEFPTPRKSPSSTQEPYSDVSSMPDWDSDAGFDGTNTDAKGNKGRRGMKTPFSSDVRLNTILKSSNRFKNTKLAIESQPSDFVPSSPSI